jgi:putative transposase
MISIARTTCRNVKRWRDGQAGWPDGVPLDAAGMLAAGRSFRRLEGYKDMPGLARSAEEVTIRRSA